MENAGYMRIGLDFLKICCYFEVSTLQVYLQVYLENSRITQMDLKVDLGISSLLNFIEFTRVIQHHQVQLRHLLQYHLFHQWLVVR